ncbi:enoyl-CoA hydratase/isomerase family protein [Paraflavitalea speifideaquila]|uniref:enoyl-CoA hydratase/isomerase family protein n=1 Tax=Paraflavitalea speifideaquila TaxID=3076558 RepID=UPI0028E6FFA4|nr:enoyl-CoA hydratase-related protein [Paraflavitalea speifideiaquila]
MYETLLVEVEQQICIITINRPDKLNALNKTVMDELSKAIDEVYNNTGIKSAIITGSGSKAFVAGADISEFQGLTKEQGMALAKKGHDIFFKIENAPKPIVAAVNGFALGGGCELALACHFMIASDNARFGQPEVNLGLIPGYGGTQRLLQAAGKGRAMELLMSGKMINAAEAQQYGLVNEVVTLDQLLPKVKEILQNIQSKAPIAIANIIECINQFDHTQKGYDLEIQKFGECFATEDMQEGVTAFLEKKRKPVFKGK